MKSGARTESLMTTPGMVIVAGGSGGIGAAISRKLVGVGQEFELTDSLAYYPLSGITSDTATAHALRSYADLRNATASVQAATFALRVQKGQSLTESQCGLSYQCAR